MQWVLAVCMRAELELRTDDKIALQYGLINDLCED